MEILVWGVTPLGKYLANNMIHKKMALRPMAYVDNNPDLQNTTIDGIPVISFVDLASHRNLGKKLTILLALSNAKNIFQILEQIETISVDNVGIVKLRAMFMGKKIDPYEDDEEITWSLFKGKHNRFIPRIEINLIDACNLKCKGCTHFSSIYKKESIYPISDYEKDIFQLKNIGEVLRVRLLGGEPFLLNNLNEYLDITRRILKTTDIEIVTNGLLIPRISDKILESIKSNYIRVIISQYPPTIKMKDQIAMRLNKSKVLWYFADGEILQFTRNLTLINTHNGELSSRICPSGSCTFFRNGKLYKCPFEGLINDFYNYYDLQMSYKGGTDIYLDKDIVFERIMDYALKPIELCKYCSEDLEYIPWSVKAEPLLNDWLYKSEIKPV